MEHSLEHLLPDPYRHLTKEQKELQLSRLSADISYEDKELLKLVFPLKGILNRLTQVFFHSLVEELKQNGITHYTPTNADLVCRIIARRCTPVEPLGEGLGEHGTGGTQGARDKAPGDYE